MVSIIGHRGGRNLWPENSIEGFRKLLELPVEGVEFDVHLTKAGEMLVIHDPTLDRTTERSGAVAELGLGENHKVRLKDSGGTIPTLDEVLDVFAGSAIELHVELKADHERKPYPGLEAKAAALLDDRGMAARSVLTSFLPEVLATIREVASHIRTLSSFDTKSVERYGLTEGLRRMLDLSDIIAIERHVLDQNWDTIVDLVPGDRLGAWVPNDEADIAYWLGKPIRQITTDRPDLAVALRGA